MNFSMKLWLWWFEFKLSKVKDNEKIEFLAKELLKELETQGYSLNWPSCGHVDIWIHSNRLYVANEQGDKSDWRIPCGTYQPVIKKEVSE